MPRHLTSLTLPVLVAFVLITFYTPPSLAEIPQVISYQGKVTDSGGTPVANGNYTMRFRIYNAASGGSLRWDSGNRTIAINDGVFNVLLGESPQPSLNLDFDEDCWLLVTFSGTNQNPRQRLASAGYAYMASGIVPGTEVSGSVNSGSFSALRCTNTATTGTNYGLYTRNYSTSGRAVLGYASASTGQNYGGHFTSGSSSGKGVLGQATASTGTTYGGYFVSSSSSGRGVLAQGSAYGGYFLSLSSTGKALYGKAAAASGYNYGVYGETASSVGRAVHGEATSTVGYNYGVFGTTASSAGTALRGIATSETGDAYGVHGTTNSGTGAGVFGVNTDQGYGVEGLSQGAGLYGTGVRGEGDWAGAYFMDTGSGLYSYVAHGSSKIYSSGTCNFVQNHPADGDRVVVYTAPEGDEVATYTRGTARLVEGEACVSLGETFQWVTNPDIGLTAHLTPRGDCHGLYVESLRTDEMVVRELEGGTSDVVFDYLVYGLRIGFEEVTIVQKKTEESYIPSMEDHRRAYAAYPDLRQYNSLERFKHMTVAAGLGDAVDFGSSQALRDAIEEFDPEIHGSADAERLSKLKLRIEEERRRLEEERSQREDSRVSQMRKLHSADSPLSE